LIIIPREVDEEDEQKSEDETVVKQTLIDAKFKTGNRGQKQIKIKEQNENKVDWKKSVKEAKICVGLYGHRRRRRRGGG